MFLEVTNRGTLLDAFSTQGPLTNASSTQVGLGSIPRFAGSRAALWDRAGIAYEPWTGNQGQVHSVEIARPPARVRFRMYGTYQLGVPSSGLTNDPVMDRKGLEVIFGAAADQKKTGDPWAVMDRLVGSVSGPKDLAAEHDHYLYGNPKRKK